MSKAQKDRPRLGRGLSSLISIGTLPGADKEEAVATLPVRAEVTPPTTERAAAAAVPAAETAPLQVSVESIQPNPHQPRRQFSETSLAELAASVRANGLIQPIVVRQLDGEYQLIAGERRWRAAKLAGLKTVPVIVREVDGFTQAQLALVENIQREDLNPLDRAAAYRTLMDQLGLTQAELANRLGEDRSSIANHLRLLDLPAAVRDQISAGTLSLGHAKVLASVSDPAEQQRLANLVIAQGLSVRNLERVVANGSAPQTRQPASQSPHLSDLEKSLARQLGLKVQLRSAPGKGKGRVVIHYASLDQFDELMERLGVKLET
jgi:ParB family transcriptional regulator, chromosome partitioning protein